MDKKSLLMRPPLLPPRPGGGAGGVASGSVERKAGRVKSCDHGRYALSYTMADAGRYLLYVKVAGLESGALLCLPLLA